MNPWTCYGCGPKLGVFVLLIGVCRCGARRMAGFSCWWRQWRQWLVRRRAYRDEICSRTPALNFSCIMRANGWASQGGGPEGRTGAWAPHRCRRDPTYFDERHVQNYAYKWADVRAPHHRLLDDRAVIPPAAALGVAHPIHWLFSGARPRCNAHTSVEHTHFCPKCAQYRRHTDFKPGIQNINYWY